MSMAATSAPGTAILIIGWSPHRNQGVKGGDSQDVAPDLFFRATRKPLELPLGRRHCHVMADPRNTDPDDRDPRERELGRRSGQPTASPWLVIGLILMLGAVVYVISAVLN